VQVSVVCIALVRREQLTALLSDTSRTYIMLFMAVNSFYATYGSWPYSQQCSAMLNAACILKITRVTSLQLDFTYSLFHLLCVCRNS